MCDNASSFVCCVSSTLLNKGSLLSSSQSLDSEFDLVGIIIVTTAADDCCCYYYYCIIIIVGLCCLCVNDKIVCETFSRARKRVPCEALAASVVLVRSCGCCDWV